MNIQTKISLIVVEYVISAREIGRKSNSFISVMAVLGRSELYNCGCIKTNRKIQLEVDGEFLHM